MTNTRDLEKRTEFADALIARNVGDVMPYDLYRRGLAWCSMHDETARKWWFETATPGWEAMFAVRLKVHGYSPTAGEKGIWRKS